MKNIAEHLAEAFEIERRCMQAYKAFVERLEKRRKERENGAAKGKRS